MKTGLNLQPINEPIVKEVMEKYNFTKFSPAINYIIQEYKRLSEVENDVVSVDKEDDKDKKPVEHDFSSWFVAEEKK
jgi:hypothetical protein